MSQPALLRDGLLGDEFPVRLSIYRSKLIDRDDLISCVTVLIKRLVTGNAIIGDALDGINHSLAESCCASSIAGTCRGLRAILDSGLDRLDQDVHAVIGSRAIGTISRCAIDLLELLDECLRLRQHISVCGSNGGIDRATGQANSRSEGAGLQTITTSIRGVLQSSNLLHLLAHQDTTGGVEASKVDHIGMHRGNLRQQRKVRRGRAWLAAVTENGATISLELFDEGVGNADTVGFGVVNDVSLLVVQRLEEIVSTNATLVVVSGSNTEVIHLARRT